MLIIIYQNIFITFLKKYNISICIFDTSHGPFSREGMVPSRMKVGPIPLSCERKTYKNIKNTCVNRVPLLKFPIFCSYSKKTKRKPKLNLNLKLTFFFFFPESVIALGMWNKTLNPIPSGWVIFREGLSWLYPQNSNKYFNFKFNFDKWWNWKKAFKYPWSFY